MKLHQPWAGGASLEEVCLYQIEVPRAACLSHQFGIPVSLAILYYLSTVEGPGRSPGPTSIYRFSLFCLPRSMPTSAARRLCLTVLQRGPPHCPPTAQASHLQAQSRSKATAPPDLAQAPSAFLPQTSIPALALRRAQQAAQGASSKATTCLSTPTRGTSKRTSSLRPRRPWRLMDTPLRLRGHWKPLRRSLWMWATLRPSCLASQQRLGAMDSLTPARNTTKFW